MYKVLPIIFITFISTYLHADVDQDLLSACKNNNYGIVISAIRSGANVNYGEDNDDGYYNAIEYSIRNKNFKIFKYLIDNGAVPEIVYEKMKYNILLVACEVGDIKIASYIVSNKLLNINDMSRGVVIFDSGEGGLTALMIAAYYGYYDICNLLLINGASTLIKSDEGRNAQLISTLRKKKKIADLIDSYQIREEATLKLSNMIDSEEFVYRELDDKYEKRLKLYLSQGANPNIAFSFGLSLFEYALENRDYKTGKLLLKHGCNIDSLYNAYSGETLLMKKASVGDLDSVRFLLENNANKNLKDDIGNTCYDYAMQNDHTNVAQYIKEYRK